MKTIFITLLLTFSVFAQYKYDYRSGNSYRTYKNSYGTTTYGNNVRTGSSWSVRHNKNGSYSARTARGHYINGNSKTGRYHNFTTGKSCWGKGQFRQCY